jgi:methionyl aminopeptidase
MSINNDTELTGMKKVAEAVAITLKEMRDHARPGMTTRELDDYGGSILDKFRARSAPYLTYNFPGFTCISVNNEFAHGVPSDKKILHDGDLVNIDVSAELDGFWADNGGSFVLGTDHHQHQQLIDRSKQILHKAIAHIKGGVRIADIGHLMESEARSSGYKVIKNLGGHGVGRGLHEAPDNILNYRNRFDKRRFKKQSVVAIETFIATASTLAVETNDAWTLVGNKGGYVAQHEHSIVITDGEPIVLTEMNEIWE